MKGLAVVCVYTQWQLGKGVAEVTEGPYPYNKFKVGLMLELLVGYRQ